MKAAISVPDDLFRSAEVAARRLRLSRSQLYTTAMAEFLERQDTDSITQRLNQIYSQKTAQLDPALHGAQLNSLDKETW